MLYQETNAMTFLNMFICGLLPLCHYGTLHHIARICWQICDFKSDFKARVFTRSKMKK